MIKTTENTVRRSSRCPAILHKPHVTVRRFFIYLYSKTAGIITYMLLLLFTYTSISSIGIEYGMLPICRRAAVPIPRSSSSEHQTLGTQDSGSESSEALRPGYVVALECKQGEGLSVLIFYGIGFLFGELTELMHLPGLLGMLIGGLCLRNVGILLVSETVYRQNQLPMGFYYLKTDLEQNLSTHTSHYNVRDARTQLAALLHVDPMLSGILRQIALATILTRAGLGLDPVALRRLAGSVFRLAFIPCICEAISLMIVSKYMIGWPWVWGAILGFVCAAVSPAVIVPHMMRLEVSGWGVAQGIPTLVVAASSLDDIIAITGFGVALAVALSTGKSLLVTLIKGPGEAVAGALFGAFGAVIICLFPPPKLDHSHFLRGIFLGSLALTGIIGSITLKILGAGALACLTLTFFVACGWRAGYPWRLTQAAEENKRANTLAEGNQFDTGVITATGNDLQNTTDEEKSVTQLQHDTSNWNVCQTLIDYHPDCYEKLRQQSESYANNNRAGSRSGKRKCDTSHAVPNRKMNFRRFSLPEDTAHYELDSFCFASNTGLGNQIGASGRPLKTLDQDDCAEQGNYNVNAIDVKPRHQNRQKATPQERGMACLNSMRRATAAVWWLVQPILFTLIGSEVNLVQLKGHNTAVGVVSLLIALLFRLGATILTVMPSKLNMKERLFIGFAWLPKATVQAAIGSVALDTARKLNASVQILGYAEQVLTLAALAILITAPLGAILISVTAPRLLRHDHKSSLVLTERTRRTQKSNTSYASETSSQNTTTKSEANNR